MVEMDLSPEERKRIYEEEKARIEKEAKLDEAEQESVAVSVTGIASKADDHSRVARSRRVTSSSFTIAWSTVLIVFLNFFNKYIAYFQYESPEWVRYPVLTEDFSAWLPIITTTLVLFIIGHGIVIAFDRYSIREATLVILNMFGVVSVVWLLVVFPFDFGGIPNATLIDGLPIIMTLILVGIAVILGIVTLVRLIKLIVDVVRGTASY